MPHLPRVPAFPIAGEKSILTAAGAALKIPAKEKNSPLIGHTAPEIYAQDHLGRYVSLHATIELGRPIVLYFFPLAGSPHCTKESCSFRDAVGTSPIFNDLNAVVIGISQDPPSRSRKFVDEHHLGFRILHDQKREIMDAWGVGRGLMGLIDGRCTFVIDQDGIVRAMLDGVWDYKGHRDFAEKWLCRIEHELSGRQRFYVEHEADDTVACDEETRNVRVVYGDVVPGRGIATAPRFGAAPAATKSKSSYGSLKPPSFEPAPVVRSSSSDAQAVPRIKSRRNLKNWLRPSASSSHAVYDEPLHVDYKLANHSADDVQPGRSTDKTRVRSGLSADHATVISRDFAEMGLRSRSREGSGSGYATPSTISARSVSTGETSHTSPGLEAHANKLAAAIKSDLERSGSSRRRVPSEGHSINGGVVRPARSSSLLKQRSVSSEPGNGDSTDPSAALVYANGNIAKMPLLPSSGERSADSKATVGERRVRGGHSNDSSMGETGAAGSLPVPPRPTTRNGGVVAAAASARLQAYASPMARSGSRGSDINDEEEDGYETDRATSRARGDGTTSAASRRRDLPPQSPVPSYAPPTIPSSSSSTNWSLPTSRSNGFRPDHPSPSPSLTNSFFPTNMDRRSSATPSLTPSQMSTAAGGSEFEYSPSLAGSTHTFGGAEE